MLTKQILLLEIGARKTYDLHSYVECGSTNKHYILQLFLEKYQRKNQRVSRDEPPRAWLERRSLH